MSAKGMPSESKSSGISDSSSSSSDSKGLVGSQIRSPDKADDKRGDKSPYSNSSSSNDRDGIAAEGDEEEDDECYYADEKGGLDPSDVPIIEVLEIDIGDNKTNSSSSSSSSSSGRAVVPVSAPLDLRIRFTLDRDVVAAYWTVKLLVDSSFKRIIRDLGSTEVEDYPDGESEMRFKVNSVDVSDIPPSVLSNFGLLMVALVVDGTEAASVNMVVNVSVDATTGQVVREIYNPLE